jgi:hypothetical protein
LSWPPGPHGGNLAILSLVARRDHVKRPTREATRLSFSRVYPLSEYYALYLTRARVGLIDRRAPLRRVEPLRRPFGLGPRVDLEWGYPSRVAHLPPVKSGKSCCLPPSARDLAESGMTALHVAAS